MRGCKVYATARQVEKMQGFSQSTIETMALDVTDDEAVRTVIKIILEKEGKIDILVNNAGVLAHGMSLPDLGRKDLFFTSIQSFQDPSSKSRSIPSGVRLKPMWSPS